VPGALLDHELALDGRQRIAVEIDTQIRVLMFLWSSLCLRQSRPILPCSKSCAWRRRCLRRQTFTTGGAKEQKDDQ